MEAYGQMIIAPNGSLVTSIYQRASRSPQVLARKFSTLIAPWIFSYGDLRMSRQDLYSPVLILLKRLAAPVATITCSLMEEDLQAIPVGLSKELFEPAVISFYSLRKE
jgi:capsular polysaccharide export protein